jgi:RNA polymerase sigma-70 factor (ECF subfamily)
VEAMQLCTVTSDFPIDDRTIEACQRGDSEGFRLLFEVYKDRVYSIALYYFNGDEASAHDITQQIFLKLLTHISQFESRSEFSTWLYRMVANACLDRKRALRRFLSFDARVDEIPATRRSMEDKFIQREREASIRSAISGLRPKLRMAILLKHFEELSYDEIAAVLGCSKGTVASRLNRGHQILAQKLAHLRRDGPDDGTLEE